MTAASSQQDIDKYLIIPGILMYAAGQWIVNLNYWGCNQYITQRALGADLKTARTGILFAAMLKLMMPIIVMLPGIAAYVLNKSGKLDVVGGMDGAYSAVLGFLPTGLKGLSIAALTAAIVASLAGKANSISTILPRYLQSISIPRRKKTGDHRKGGSGMRYDCGGAFTWDDLLVVPRVYFYSKVYRFYKSRCIRHVPSLGMFWKRTTGTAAIVGLLTGFGLSVFFNEFAPAVMGHETFLYTAYPNGKGGFEIPFLICMGLAFMFTIIVMVLLSLAGPKINPKAFELDKSMFKLPPNIIAMIVVILLILMALYVKFW